MHGGGWLDLIGSIPAIPWIPFTGLLRLARIARLGRILRMMRGQAGRDLVRDVIVNRGEYATFITILAAIMVLALSSIAVLQFESKAAGANIKTGGEALWWAVVTITTVGYGDYFPVTGLGRLTAFLVMVAGVGIIGALASILASVLVANGSDTRPPPRRRRTAPGAIPDKEPMGSEVVAELARLTAEITALREKLEAREA